MTHSNNKVAFGLGFIPFDMHTLIQSVRETVSPFDGFLIPKRELNKFMIFRMKIALFKSLSVFAHFLIIFCFCFLFSVFVSFKEIAGHLYAYDSNISINVCKLRRSDVCHSKSECDRIYFNIQHSYNSFCSGFDFSMFQSSNVVSRWLLLLLLSLSSLDLTLTLLFVNRYKVWSVEYGNKYTIADTIESDNFNQLFPKTRLNSLQLDFRSHFTGMTWISLKR